MKKNIFLLILMLFGLWAYPQYTKQIVVEQLLKTDTTSIGQPIKYPAVKRPEVSVLKITIAPGGKTGWHKHQIPLFAYVEEGVLTVEWGKGKRKQFNKGTAVAEMLNTSHQGINEGNVPVVLIAVYLGGDGKMLAEKEED